MEIRTSEMDVTNEIMSALNKEAEQAVEGLGTYDRPLSSGWMFYPGIRGNRPPALWLYRRDRPVAYVEYLWFQDRRGWALRPHPDVDKGTLWFEDAGAAVIAAEVMYG